MKKPASKLSTVFCVNGELTDGGGEDSFYYGADGERLTVAVFDGCGGSGARRYAAYSGMSGAYVGARAVCGAYEDWFARKDNSLSTLESSIADSLAICTDNAEKSTLIKGKLGKTFPTTMAAMIAYSDAERLKTSCLWAGDSRCYCLDESGLHQLSMDDIEGGDAMSNLSGDGVLKNVICADGKPMIHHAEYEIQMPCMIFAATDGCFAYMRTPMLFEQELLACVSGAKNVAECREMLRQVFEEYSGDDYTICLAGYGFDSFDEMARFCRKRLTTLRDCFIGDDERDTELWERYKPLYYSYILEDTGK